MRNQCLRSNYPMTQVCHKIGMNAWRFSRKSGELWSRLVLNFHLNYTNRKWKAKTQTKALSLKLERGRSVISEKSKLHIRDFCVCGLGSDLVSPTEGTQTNGHSSCCLYQLAATRQRPRHSLAHSFIHSLTGPLRHVSVQVGLARLSLRSSWWVSTHTHSPIHPPTSITPIGLVLWRALALWLHGCALLLSPGKAIVCVRKYWVCAWKISYLNNNSIFIYFQLCCEVELVFFLKIKVTYCCFLFIDFALLQLLSLGSELIYE